MALVPPVTVAAAVAVGDLGRRSRAQPAAAVAERAANAAAAEAEAAVAVAEVVAACVGPSASLAGSGSPDELSTGPAGRINRPAAGVCLVVGLP